jgi:hypothetical protein
MLARCVPFQSTVGHIAPMASGYFITHPDVIIDPAKPIERWGLSPRGRERMRFARAAMAATGGLRAVEQRAASRRRSTARRFC